MRETGLTWMNVKNLLRTGMVSRVKFSKPHTFKNEYTYSMGVIFSHHLDNRPNEVSADSEYFRYKYEVVK